MQLDFNQAICKTILINADKAKIWKTLTDPRLMEKWMLDDGKIEIVTDWKIGQPILIKGDMHGIPFENQGVVIQFEQESQLEYAHLSSLSMLPDVKAS